MVQPGGQKMNPRANELVWVEGLFGPARWNSGNNDKDKDDEMLGEIFLVLRRRGKRGVALEVLVFLHGNDGRHLTNWNRQTW